MEEIDIDLSNSIEANSYIKKEELMNMLENIDFIAVREADLSLITGFIATEDEIIKPLCKTIRID